MECYVSRDGRRDAVGRIRVLPSHHRWPVLFVIMGCAIPHMLGLGPLPWFHVEIQPTRVRAKAVALSTTILWIAAFLGTYFFPWLARISEEPIGSIAGVFWLFRGSECTVAGIRDDNASRDERRRLGGNLRVVVSPTREVD